MYARCCAARGASNERAIGTYEPAGPSIGVTTRIATRTAAIAASERHDRTRPSAIGVRSNRPRRERARHREDGHEVWQNVPREQRELGQAGRASGLEEGPALQRDDRRARRAAEAPPPRDRKREDERGEARADVEGEDPKEREQDGGERSERIDERGDDAIGGTPREPSCDGARSEEHTSELQSPCNLVCRLLLEKKKTEHPFHRLPPCFLPHAQLEQLLHSFPLTDELTRLPAVDDIFVVLPLTVQSMIITTTFAQ